MEQKDRVIRATLSSVNNDRTLTKISEKVGLRSELEKENIEQITKLSNDICLASRTIQNIFSVPSIIQDIHSVSRTIQDICVVPPVFKYTDFNDKISNITHPYLSWLNDLQGFHDKIRGCFNWLESVRLELPAEDFFESMQQLHKSIEAIINDKKECENNIWHLLTEEELQETTEKLQVITKEFEKINTKYENLEEKYRTLKEEIGLAMLEYQEKKANKTISTKTTIQTLKPNITIKQIEKIALDLSFIFQSSINQWEDLFSNNIPIFEKPIVLKSKTLSDIAILFHWLKEYEFIENNNYPSILERCKVFTFHGEIITARQITKPKENTNFPDIGENYIKISEIVEFL